MKLVQQRTCIAIRWGTAVQQVTPVGMRNKLKQRGHTPRWRVKPMIRRFKLNGRRMQSKRTRGVDGKLKPNKSGQWKKKKRWKPRNGTALRHTLQSPCESRTEHHPVPSPHELKKKGDSAKANAIHRFNCSGWKELSALGWGRGYP